MELTNGECRLNIITINGAGTGISSSSLIFMIVLIDSSILSIKCTQSTEYNIKEIYDVSYQYICITHCHDTTYASTMNALYALTRDCCIIVIIML